MNLIRISFFFIVNILALKCNCQVYLYYLEYSGYANASNISGNVVRTYTKTAGGNWTKMVIERYPRAKSENIKNNSQTISNLSFTCNPTGTTQQVITDVYGNQYSTWEVTPSGPSLSTVTITNTYNGSTETSIPSVCFSDPLPPSDIPSDIQVYINPSTNIQSGNAAIIAEAESIIDGCITVQCAVEAIAKWIRGNITYNNASGIGQDALSTYNRRSGNCTGFTQLTIALLRSVGIPSRFVSGDILPKPHDMAYNGGTFQTGTSGPGLHAQHEIYYPSISDWVRGDAQSHVHYGGIHFIKYNHGPDSDNTGFSVMYYYTGTPPTIAKTTTINSTIESVDPQYVFHNMTTFQGSTNGGFALLAVNNACGPPVGLGDAVDITSGPDIVQNGEDYIYTAEFYSESGTTYAVNYRWYIDLFSLEGDYLYAQEEIGSDTWVVSLSEDLPERNWTPDLGGNIAGRISVIAEINDGDAVSDEKLIGLDKICYNLILDGIVYTTNETVSKCQIQAQDIIITNNCSVIFDIQEQANISGPFEVHNGSSFQIK